MYTCVFLDVFSVEVWDKCTGQRCTRQTPQRLEYLRSYNYYTTVKPLHEQGATCLRHQVSSVPYSEVC